jgi:hypothetical protein
VPGRTEALPSGSTLLNLPAAGADHRRVRFVGRVLIKLVVVLAGITAGIALWVAAIQAGIVGNPLDPVIGGDVALVRSDRPGVRVLFVGNSLTDYNDMPSMVRRLGAEDDGGPRLFVVDVTAPGWSLWRASRHEGLLELLRDVRWNHVVLQERSSEHYPFFDDLDARAGAAGARTVIFDLGLGGAAPYAEHATRLGATLAPVWGAWENAHDRRPGLPLYHDDGRHPNRAGSFLIACVFYAVITGRDPAGNDYTAGLDQGDARFLQDVARDVVLR